MSENNSENTPWASVHEARRRNLTELLQMFYDGNADHLEERLKISPQGQLRKIVNTPGSMVATALAYAIEDVAGLPRGWLDDQMDESWVPLHISHFDREPLEAIAAKEGKSTNLVLAEAITLYCNSKIG